MEERYSRNMAAFSAEELAVIRQKRVLVVGCGGLGGHVLQSLARFGVGRLTLVDGDCFSKSNLNRQLFATARTLGQNKAQACKEALADINPDVEVLACPEMLAAENADALVAGQDIAVDCLDNVPARRLLGECCAKHGVPLVHGAIGGFYGQVANIFPGESLLETIYPANLNTDTLIDKKLGNPAFIPQLVGAVQSCEALKILAGCAEALRGGMLQIDMLHGSMEFIEMA
ncbi:HesA/MoeB/ThiF family protein [Ruminococcaceae bacterium OttesenSCG-928-A11]|nr:HesA/MoeB/ThiF family protein [Ruminococcaceae bacterium OttesenSCG-928-A11]